MKQNLVELVSVGLVGLAMIVMAGCAQPPTEQLEAAQKAVEAASAAGATEYAKEDFTALEEQFALAKEELGKQEKALSIFRSYSDANKLLIKVVEDSDRVAAKAAQNKDAARTGALSMEKEAQQAIASVNALMATAPTGKERATLEVMKRDLAGLESSLVSVHQLIEKGEYLSAEAKAKAVKDEGSVLSEEIRKAIDKTKGKRPKNRA